MDNLYVIALLYHLLLATGIQCQTARCPDPQEILPCICNEYIYPTTEITCSSVMSSDELANVFNRKFNDTSFGRLSIERNNYLEEIRVGDLGNASFVEISIFYGVLKTIEPLAFSGSYKTAKRIAIEANLLENFPYEEIPEFQVLEDFNLAFNNITLFPERLVSDSLIMLTLDYNVLKSVPAEGLQGLTNLNIIHLAQTNLSTILPGTFMGLNNLTYVDVAFNNFTEIYAGLFEFSTTGILLHLAQSNIETIAVDAFPGVRSVILWGNHLKLFPEDVWRPFLEAGGRMNIKGNPFECGCDLAWLVLNTTLMGLLEEQVDPYQEAKCADGISFFDLDPALYEDC